MIPLAQDESLESIGVPESPLSPSAILQSAERRRAMPQSTMEIADRLVELMQDPEQLHSVIDNVADPIEEHAPQLANDLRLSTMNALSFLASKAPRRSLAAPGLKPLDPPVTDVRRFERYVDAVNNPTKLLEDAAHGALTSEAVEAVKTVYPKIYETIQAQIAERLDRATNLSYQRRMQLSSLLGQDMTGTKNPRMGVMAQSIYGSQQPAQAPSQQQMPVSRAGKLNVSGREGRETAAWREAQPQGAQARALGAGAKF
jgi:hypothetical protein